MIVRIPARWILVLLLAGVPLESCGLLGSRPATPESRMHSRPEVAPGEVVVTREGEVFSVVAKDAKRILILKELAKAAGIEAYADRGPKQSTMSLDLHDASLVDVVRAVAQRDRFWLVYDRASDEHRLSEILVGERADRIARFVKAVKKMQAAKEAERKKKADAASTEGGSPIEGGTGGSE